MLPTFVIGLREGLEAALIVGIIAAFLGRQGRRDLLRWVFVGVCTAVLLCLGVGIALKEISENLPQRQQEGLETIVGILAVGMVTYMLLWMRKHSRQLKADLESLAADALGKGGNRAGRAMVLMAFLAVLREGFETVVFLLAAFNAASDRTTAAGGAALGIVVAVVLGYGIYRGGVRIDLSKFFRVTGMVLVLVAAGLVVNALHTAHEAGWLNVGQGSTVNLTWLVSPGSVRESLLTGMLGLQAEPVVIEVIGWFAYLIPVGLFVAWPPGRRIPRRAITWGAGVVAVGGAVAAVVLAVAAPAAPPANPPLAAGAMSAQVVDLHGTVAVVRTSPISPASSASSGSAGAPQSREAAGANAAAASDFTLHRVRSEVRAGVDSDVFVVSQPGTAAAGRPTHLTYSQIAALNGGRLPLGVRPVGATGDEQGSVAVRYLDTTTLTVWVEPSTGSIVDLRWDETVDAEAVGTPVGTVPLESPVAKATRALPAGVASASAATALDAVGKLSTAQSMRTAAQVVGGVAVAGLIVLIALLVSGRRGQRRPVIRQVEQSTVA